MPLDPYRTLGLSPGASADEIRRAYRALAKANHPDSAGEKALPRFLAIQAAYEMLIGPSGARGTGRVGSRPTAARGPRTTWHADPDRARGAREGATNGTAGAAAGKRRRPAADEPRRPGSGRKRPSNKATLGSTTYDAFEDEPFEPEWSGGTWYGSSSGTYWTVNPKEYADPRKHGPEYQRRARRRTADGTTADDPADGTGDLPPDVTPGGEPEPETFSGTWQRWTEEPPPPDPAGPPPNAERPPETTDDAFGAERFAAAGVAAASGLLGDRGGFASRVGLALVGWPPIGIAISMVVGEVTGCGRFAASCVDVFGVGTWIAQVAVIAILLALPSVAALSAVGTLAALAASVPTAVILSATGGAREPATSAAILAGVLVASYLAGVAFALVRRRRLPRVP